MKSALLTSARSSSRLFPLHATEGEWLRPQRPQGFRSTLHVTVPDRPAAAKAVLRNEALHILLGPPGTVFHVPLALFPALAVLSTPKDPPLRNLTIMHRLPGLPFPASCHYLLPIHGVREGTHRTGG